MLNFDGIFKIGGEICMANVGDLIRLILEEAHCTTYYVHSRASKMYMT